MKYRGEALKVRAKSHIITTMASLSSCSFGAPGAGPKEIGERAGFNFHSEQRRHYARGLLLELIQEEKVETVPVSPDSTRNRYRFTRDQYQFLHDINHNYDPSYILDLEQEGNNIVIAAKKLYVDAVRELIHKQGQASEQTSGRYVSNYVKSREVEEFSGLIESRDLVTSQRGYWAWLIREELVYQNIVEKINFEGEILVKLV